MQGQKFFLRTSCSSYREGLYIFVCTCMFISMYIYLSILIDRYLSTYIDICVQETMPSKLELWDTLFLNVDILRRKSRKPGMLKSFGIVNLGCHYILVRKRIRSSVEENRINQHLKSKRRLSHHIGLEIDYFCKYYFSYCIFYCMQ